MGQGEKIIAIDSHIDTVGIGNINNWEADPYKGYETEDVIYGRGGSDQEGGMASAVYHGVDVGVDGNDLLALAHPADDVAQAVDLDLVIAQLLHLGLDAHDHFLLLAALAGMGDHVPQEPAHVRLIALCRFLDRFEVHNEYPPSKICSVGDRFSTSYHNTENAVVKQNF